MQMTTQWKLSCGVLAFCLLCPAARADRLYNTLTQPALAQFEPNLKDTLRLEVGIPIDEQGSAGVMPIAAFQMRLAKWLAAGAELGWVMGTDGGQTLSNLGLELKAGWIRGHRTKGRGIDLALLGDLRLGFGLVDTGGAAGAAATAQGFLGDLRRQRFGAESAVIEPVLVLAAAGGMLGAELYTGPSFAFPVRDTDTREVATGFLYGAMVSADLYLCDLGLGIRGFSSFGEEDQTYYALEAGVRVNIKSPRLSPFVRATIPLSDDPIDLATVVVFGVNWMFAEGREETPSAPKPPEL